MVQLGLIVTIRNKRAFAHRPTIVAAAHDDVDLLDMELPNVGVVENACDRIESQVLGMAKTEGLALRQPTRFADEWIVRRYTIGTTVALTQGIDPKDLAQRAKRVLGVVVLIGQLRRVAPVSGADIKLAVVRFACLGRRIEQDRVRGVVGAMLRDAQDLATALRIDPGPQGEVDLPLR